MSTFRRSATDTKLAGVCGGVAARWGLDPVLVRVGFVLLALTGGIGVIDDAAWKQTVDISMTTKNQTGDTVLKKAPEGLAYTNDYINQAITQAKAAGVDVT